MTVQGATTRQVTFPGDATTRWVAFWDANPPLPLPLTLPLTLTLTLTPSLSLYPNPTPNPHPHSHPPPHPHPYPHTNPNQVSFWDAHAPHIAGGTRTTVAAPLDIIPVYLRA